MDLQIHLMLGRVRFPDANNLLPQFVCPLRNRGILVTSKLSLSIMLDMHYIPNGTNTESVISENVKLKR